MSINEQFNADDYEMPQIVSEKPLKEEVEISEEKPDAEDILEKRFEEEKAFLNNLDTVSGKASFEGEALYIEKLKEFAERMKNPDDSYGVDYKIYVEKLSQLRDQHQRAIGLAANRIELEQKNVSSLSFRNELSDKIDEIGERKTIIVRQIYDLEHYMPKL